MSCYFILCQVIMCLVLFLLLFVMVVVWRILFPGKSGLIDINGFVRLGSFFFSACHHTRFNANEHRWKFLDVRSLVIFFTDICAFRIVEYTHNFCISICIRRQISCSITSKCDAVRYINKAILFSFNSHMVLSLGFVVACCRLFIFVCER